jgi:hypothetical protein
VLMCRRHDLPPDRLRRHQLDQRRRYHTGPDPAGPRALGHRGASSRPFSRVPQAVARRRAGALCGGLLQHISPTWCSLLSLRRSLASANLPCTTTLRGDGGSMPPLLPARFVHTSALYRSSPREPPRRDLPQRHRHQPHRQRARPTWPPYAPPSPQPLSRRLPAHPRRPTRPRHPAETLRLHGLD